MIIYSYSEPLNNTEQTHTKHVLDQNQEATVWLSIVQVVLL